MAVLAVLAGSLLLGVVSGLVPVVSAEAYLAATAGVAALPTAVAAALAVGLGQAVGKLVVFLAARRGARLRLPWRRGDTGPVPPRPAREPGPFRTRLAGWGRRGLALLDRPLVGGGVVLASAGVGVPPLAVTAVAAGLSRMRPAVFAATVLTGRTGWFLLVTFASDQVLGLFGR